MCVQRVYNIPTLAYQPRCAVGVDGPEPPATANTVLEPPTPPGPPFPVSSGPLMERKRASPAAAPRDGGGGGDGSVASCAGPPGGSAATALVLVDRRRLRERGGGLVVAVLRKSGVVAVDGGSSRIAVEALGLRSSRVLAAICVLVGYEKVWVQLVLGC